MSFDKKLDEFTGEVSKLWKKAKKGGSIKYEQLVAQNAEKAIAACPAYVELGEQLVGLREWIVNTSLYLQKLIANLEKTGDEQAGLAQLFSDVISRNEMKADGVEQFATSAGTYKTRMATLAATIRDGNEIKQLNELRDASANLARMKQKWSNNLVLKMHFEERKNTASPENQARIQADLEYRERKCLYYEQTLRDGVGNLAHGKSELMVSLVAVHQMAIEEQNNAFRDCFDSGLQQPPAVLVE